jgi:hypothetical protein
MTPKKMLEGRSIDCIPWLDYEAPYMKLPSLGKFKLVGPALIHHQGMSCGVAFDLCGVCHFTP